MKTPPRLPTNKEQALIDTTSVRPIRPEEYERCMRLLDKQHYLGSLKPVGERMIYVAVSPNGGWRAILVFCAAAMHLKHRDEWIGWESEQRRQRLSLVANNARFLILKGYDAPNMATRVLALALGRLSKDWSEKYAHPVAVVETFVDPDHFQGTIYKAGGWTELGRTSGNGRVGRDYYVKHDKPKRLFAIELVRNARRSLRAERLKPEFAKAQRKAIPLCKYTVGEIRGGVEHFKQVPDYRARIGSYPLWSLLAIVALAYLCGAPRGQKDLAKFAKQMSRSQRRALGIRRNAKREIPSPTQPTFCRLLRSVDARAVETAILAFQKQVRGPAPKGEQVAIDGKAAKRSGGEIIFNAVAVPSLYYLGSEPVPVDKTNEIPVARELLKRLDLEDRLVGADALHTQTETARVLVMEKGADYSLTVKDNQKGLRKTIAGLFAATEAAFSPWTHHLHNGMDPRDQQGAPGTPPNPRA